MFCMYASMYVCNVSMYVRAHGFNATSYYDMYVTLCMYVWLYMNVMLCTNVCLYVVAYVRV